MAIPAQHYTIINLPGKLLSAAEYALLPDEPDWRMELDRGKVVKMPAVKDPLTTGFSRICTMHFLHT